MQAEKGEDGQERRLRVGILVRVIRWAACKKKSPHNSGLRISFRTERSRAPEADELGFARALVRVEARRSREGMTMQDSEAKNGMEKGKEGCRRYW